MAKLYNRERTQVKTEKMARVYEYIAEHYDECNHLIKDIRDKKMNKDDKKTVFSTDDLSLTEKIRYRSLIQRNENIIKDIRKIGGEEFILGLSTFMDIQCDYGSKDKVSASMKNLALFQKKLKELGFDYTFITKTSSTLNMQLRFEENFITDGEIIDYNVVDSGVLQNLFGDDDQRLNIKLKDSTFIIVKELDSFKNKESFTNRVYVLSNYPNINKLKWENEQTLFQKEHPLIEELNQHIKEEDYADNYKELYDDRIEFFKDLKVMKKEAKKLGIFETIIQDVEDKAIEDIMDRDDLNLLKALLLKGRKLDNVPRPKTNKK